MYRPSGDDGGSDDSFTNSPLFYAIAYGVLWYLGVVPGCDIDADARDKVNSSGVEQRADEKFSGTHYIPPKRLFD